MDRYQNNYPVIYKDDYWDTYPVNLTRMDIDIIFL